ncbi:MAG TPA: GNA1162 family protein, partial [Nitrospirota bacterium]|nr:GNA1162 family protein [Nitrospirota bacterium]
MNRICFIASFLLLAGCVPQNNIDYTAYRQSNPRSILVLPPLNNSPDIRATYSFLSTVTQPLAEAGYYVFPVALVDQTFKENGLPNPGEMHQAPLDKLREIFGADATLFITIMQYGSAYRILSSEVRVTAEARLVDNRSGQVLWQGRATASN